MIGPENKGKELKLMLNEYAKFLAKIYTRYDDKEKAAYYYKRSK